MRAIQKNVGLALVGLGVALSACAGAPAPTATQAFVDAPSKTNGAAVALRYRVDAETAVGQAVSIDLQFAKAREGATVRLVAGQGLYLESAPTLSLPVGASTASVVVRPQATGRLYLNVFISQDGRGSAISIPVQVGPKSVVQKASPARDDDKDVIVMPVD